MWRAASLTSPLNAIATAIAMLVSLVAPPGVYSIAAYTNLVATMQSQANLDAADINNKIISKAPKLWTYQEIRLKELMSRRIPKEGRSETFLSTVDNHQKTVAAVGAPQPWPTVARSSSLFDAGRLVGQLEIQRSLRPLIFNAALLSLFGLLLAAASFVTLRVIPLRAALKANKVLRHHDLALSFANAVLAAATEGSLDAILIVDHDGRIVSYNRHFIDMWRIPPAMVEARIDEPVLATVVAHMRDPVGFLARVKYLYDHPEDASQERLDLKDGRIVDRHTQSLYGPDQKYLGRIWFFRDITEREHAAEVLKQSEQRFRAIFDNARDGIVLVDPDSKKLISGNACLGSMLGYSPEELTALTVADIHPAEIMPVIAKELAERARGAAGALVDIPIKRKDGSILFVDINAAPVQIGAQHFVIGIFRDITERKRAAEALAKNEEKYRNLVESTTDFIWEVDADGRYTYVSPAVKPLIGYQPQELIGKSPFDMMPPAEAERVGKIFGEIVAAHQPFSSIENTNLRKDGVEIVLETSGVPILGDDGTLKGYRGIDRDVTQRKTAELALQRRDALLHAVTVSATEFLTSVSLEEAMPRALKQVSHSILVDRIVVVESGETYPSAPTLRYIWQAPDIAVSIDAELFKNTDLLRVATAEWQPAAIEGRIVLVNAHTASDGVKRLLKYIGVKTLLIVPIMIDGRNWGQISFETCKAERSWAEFEIEILRTLAELIGNAIQRERYVNEITNANRIVQNTPTILYRIRGEPSLPMIYISQNITLFGHEPAALTASPHLYQNLIHPDDIVKFRIAMAQILDDSGQRGAIEFRMLTGHGDYRWVENRYTPIRDAAGRLVEVEGLLIDVTERKAAEEKIALLARTDPLTGLANRTTYIERLRQTFAAARRGAASFAVLYLDIDRFKDINDTLGHPLGDRLLTTVAERLTNGVRETDIVARFGGDEFAIMQTDLSDTADAGTLAATLRAALAEPIQLGGNEVHITASIGISIYSTETVKPEDMLAQADVALYRAKEEGRDQYRFHTEELDLEVRKQVTVAEELRLAIERNEFVLHYQPQVELSTGQIVGMEALVRWNHPTRGLLLPGEFLATAERTGAIAAIGHWVLDHACRQMSLWRKEGIAPLTIAVNMSPAQIKAANEFVQYVCDTLKKWDLQAVDLELDVTESMLARATFAQSDVLERLHKLGVKIAIDDFGTKYSTLDYLKTYRVNRLKIPQRLINAATQDAESAAMVRAIVGIARELNIEVIAQGVETEAQWTYLTATSPVTKVQGYFYSEPVPANHADELLRRGRINPPESRRGKETAHSMATAHGKA